MRAINFSNRKTCAHTVVPVCASVLCVRCVLSVALCDDSCFHRSCCRCCRCRRLWLLLCCCRCRCQRCGRCRCCCCCCFLVLFCCCVGVPHGPPSRRRGGPPARAVRRRAAQDRGMWRTLHCKEIRRSALSPATMHILTLSSKLCVDRAVPCAATKRCIERAACSAHDFHAMSVLAAVRMCALASLHMVCPAVHEPVHAKLHCCDYSCCRRCIVPCARRRCTCTPVAARADSLRRRWCCCLLLLFCCCPDWRVPALPGLPAAPQPHHAPSQHPNAAAPHGSVLRSGGHGCSGDGRSELIVGLVC